MTSENPSSKRSAPQSDLDLHPAQLQRYLRAAFEACDGAGKILNSYFGNLRSIDEKFQAGLVSEADRESEELIIACLRSQFPNHSFFGEESGFSNATDLSSPEPSNVEASLVDTSGTQATKGLWMIDPLDGTTNYVHRFPLFCISIGLEINGELAIGVVDAPKLGFRYHAVKGGGAFLNGEPIHVSARKEFREGLFATGFWSHDDSNREQLELLMRVVRESRGLRRAGSAALDLCFVAEGIFDAFWEKNLQPWDTAAGTLIAREAGAKVTDFNGYEFTPHMKSILCSNQLLHAELQKELSNLV